MQNKSKTLYLVRHAKSSWKDSSLGDRDRPLNKRGRRSARDMGARLAKQGHLPDLIISSPAKRAYSTAKKIARAAGYDKSDIRKEENLYFAGIFSMCNVLEELDDIFESVMMVGHNPAMTNLLNTLCETSIVNMPTCAIAIIQFDFDSWPDLGSEDGTLIGYDYPKGPGNFETLVAS